MPASAAEPKRQFRVESAVLRVGQTLSLGADDQAFYAGTRDDLSLGGQEHTFLILRQIEAS